MAAGRLRSSHEYPPRHEGSGALASWDLVISGLNVDWIEPALVCQRAHRRERTRGWQLGSRHSVLADRRRYSRLRVPRPHRQRADPRPCALATPDFGGHALAGYRGSLHARQAHAFDFSRRREHTAGDGDSVRLVCRPECDGYQQRDLVGECLEQFRRDHLGRRPSGRHNLSQRRADVSDVHGEDDDRSERRAGSADYDRGEPRSRP